MKILLYLMPFSVEQWKDVTISQDVVSYRYSYLAFTVLPAVVCIHFYRFILINEIYSIFAVYIAI